MMIPRPLRIETAWVDAVGEIVTGAAILAPDDPAYAEELAACLEEERRWGVPVPFVEDEQPYAPAPVRYEPGSPSWYEYVRHLAHERGLDTETIQRWCPGLSRAEIERAVRGE